MNYETYIKNMKDKREFQDIYFKTLCNITKTQEFKKRI